jgi:hypothetical protein
VESTLVGIVLTSVGEFSVVHVVLAAAIALDDADDAEEEDEEGKGENHADEPAGGGDAVFAWWSDENICKRGEFVSFVSRTQSFNSPPPDASNV